MTEGSIKGLNKLLSKITFNLKMLCFETASMLLI